MAITDRQGRVVRLLWRRARIVGVFAILLLASSAVWNISQKERDSRVMRDRAEQELADLRTQESRLQEGIATLQTTRGKEEALREQYSVGKPGEKLVIIIEPQKAAIAQASTTVFQWVHKFLPFW